MLQLNSLWVEDGPLVGVILGESFKFSEFLFYQKSGLYYLFHEVVTIVPNACETYSTQQAEGSVLATKLLIRYKT